MTEEDDIRQEEEIKLAFAQMSDEERKAALDNYPVPFPEAKHNVHTFLNNVLETKDTTKVGFLSETELGSPIHSVRAYKELALISNVIIGNPLFEKYFSVEGENTLASSLSRNGFLVKMAITQTRKIEDMTKPKGENKGWFKGKGNKEKDNMEKF